MFQVFDAGCMMFKSCQSSVNLYDNIRNCTSEKEKLKTKRLLVYIE